MQEELFEQRAYLIFIDDKSAISKGIFKAPALEFVPADIPAARGIESLCHEVSDGSKAIFRQPIPIIPLPRKEGYAMLRMRSLILLPYLVARLKSGKYMVEH